MNTRKFGRTQGAHSSYRRALRQAMSVCLTAPFFQSGTRRGLHIVRALFAGRRVCWCSKRC